MAVAASHHQKEVGLLSHNGDRQEYGCSPLGHLGVAAPAEEGHGDQKLGLLGDKSVVGHSTTEATEASRSGS